MLATELAAITFSVLTEDPVERFPGIDKTD
jgi:hypothetical protein